MKIIGIIRGDETIKAQDNTETYYTLVRGGQGGTVQYVVIETEDYVETFSNLAYDKWQEDDKSPTLRNSGGIYGRGAR